MGVNGQKLNFQAIGWRRRDKGVETAWNSFLSAYNIATASSDNNFVNKSGGGVKGLPISRRKWSKWPNIEFSGKWQEMVGQWGGNIPE